MNKALVFDIWGDYAHFKKIETTTSPLTYSIPTGTAISGLIAAILGYERDSYYHLFSKDQVKFAVRPLHSISKVRINQNLINTASPPYLNLQKENPRTQIPYEYVREPKYRIYVSLNHRKLHQQLKEMLANHKSVYTPYLGITEHIANFSYIDEFPAEKMNVRKCRVHSVVPKEKAEVNLERVEEGMRWIQETIPLYMDEERVVQEYAEVLLEANARAIPVKETKFFKIGKENIIFL